MIDLDAISERLAVAERNFLDAVERDLTANSSRTAEAVTIAKFYPSVFEDVRALIAEVERLKATDEMQRNAIQAYEHGPAILKVIDDALARPSRIPASTISEIESMLRQRMAVKPEDTD